MAYQRTELPLPDLGFDTWKVIALLAPRVVDAIMNQVDPTPEVLERRAKRRARREKRREVRRARKADKRFRKNIEDAHKEYLDMLRDGEIDQATYQQWKDELQDGAVWRVAPDAPKSKVE
ncbi:hypothetical protein LEM8419_03534 [Neolewinella maritima]|uniref:Uncharacterized protein n=1 Tax=Neolewinella maritima TaxID=1383882 RepID=A0ABM9B5K4_9BACT|nr:hypothetical protein [Neolewinella maritima]CAH1002662.1 hypothetical protein LEM8419_03534 [Neolewinella maritima]